MFNFSDVISKKIKWLELSAKTHARNIAHADINGAKYHNIISFEKFMRENQFNNIEQINQPIKREFESMEVVKANLNHAGLLDVMKSYLQMLKTSSTRSGV